MRAKEVVMAWVKAFNRADPDDVARCYAEDALDHEMPDQPVLGRAAIREHFAAAFKDADLVRIVENLVEEGDWAVLEWRDPDGLRGCACFQVREDRILLRRGYWDKLTHLRQHGLPVPRN